jgi:hypothetical protein
MNDYYQLKKGITYVAYYYNQGSNNETRKYIFVKDGIEGCVLFKNDVIDVFCAGAHHFGLCKHFELATEYECLWLNECIKKKNIVEFNMDIPYILKKLNL